MKITVAGTGTRSLALTPDISMTVENKVVSRLQDGIKKGYDITVMSGMAEGFDAIMVEAAIRCNLPCIGVVPNLGYADYYWKRNSQSGQNMLGMFYKLAKYCKDTGGLIASCGCTVVKPIDRCDHIYINGMHSNFFRNQYMVDHCDLLMVYESTSAGTRHCLSYAQKVGRKYSMITLQEGETKVTNPNATPNTALKLFYEELEKFDWFYEYSDDSRCWNKGRAEEKRLNQLAESIEGGNELMAAFRAHHFSGPTFGTPQVDKPNKPE